MEEFLKFIVEHKNDNADRLYFRFHNDEREWMGMALSHIEALPKGRKKFPDLPADWIFPSKISVEQATPRSVAAINFRAAVSALRQSEEAATKTGASSETIRVLDMTAGLGMDALEFAEAGCEITLCELNPQHAGALRRNFSRFPNATVVVGDSVEWLAPLEENRKFDIIFIDPARRDSNGGRVYNLHDCAPDLVEILPLIKRHCRVLVAKLSPMLDITQTFRDLPECREIHAVENGAECCELLAVVNFEEEKEREIIVDRNGRSIHIPFDSGNLPVQYADPEVGDWLIEPSAAMMKAFRPGWLCEKYSIRMVAPDSRLFLVRVKSGEEIGNSHKIINIYDLSAGKLKKIGREIKAAEVVVRNLQGMTSEQLRQRLGVGESSERRLVGTTLADGRKVLLLLDKLS